MVSRGRGANHRVVFDMRASPLLLWPLLLLFALQIDLVWSTTRCRHDEQCANTKPSSLAMVCSTSLSPSACLRLYLDEYKMDAYIVPSGDAHNSEYVAACDQRRAFISNFTGSSGTAIVVRNRALKNMLFTDSRYFLAVEKQINLTEWNWNKPPMSASPTDWLIQNLLPGSFVGIDPTLISWTAYRSQRSSLAAKGITLVSMENNLVDLVWGTKRPAYPSSPLFVLTLNYTGRSSFDKMSSIRAQFQAQNVTVAIFSALDNIAWLTNLRGRDIEYNNVFFSYFVLTLKEAILYVDSIKLANTDVQKYLRNEGIAVREYMTFFSDLPFISASCLADNRVWLTGVVSARIYEEFSPTVIYSGPNPITYQQAVKNEVEVQGMRRAHETDSIAFVLFFDWLEQELASGRKVDECQVGDVIERFRKPLPEFIELSYGTIAGSGANGASPHYSAVYPDCASVDQYHMLVLDSGGQYLSGTTDTTRTIHPGNATFFERHAFTRVLQGHIDQSLLIWKAGSSPSDFTARQALLKDALEYGHGTSHGLGEDLSVHEAIGGPVIEGIVTSIEPGYYIVQTQNNTRAEKMFPGWNTAAFGVRIETDYLVVKADTPLSAGAQFYEYRPLAVVPIQTSLLRTSIMTDMQIDWLNSYHQYCFQVVTPLLKQYGTTSALSWLERNTQPIKKIAFD